MIRQAVIGKACGIDIVLQDQALEVFEHLSDSEKKEWVDSVLHEFAIQYIEGKIKKRK